MIEVPKAIELYQIWPVLVPVITLGLILLCALIFDRIVLRNLLVAVTGVGLAATVASAWLLAGSGSRHVFAASLISGSIIFDRLFLFMSAFLSVFLFGILILSVALWKRTAWEWPIFWCLLLGSLVGMILLASTRHLIFFAVAFELASMPSYVLVGFRRFNAKSAEGAAKYVVFGAACSAVMFYGISLLYGLSGSFDFLSVSRHLIAGGVQPVEIMALLCLFVGVGFKISLAPMHFWSPDAFEAAGADIAAWLSAASKSAALIALARFIYMIAPGAGDHLQHIVMVSVGIVAIATMTVANLSAYRQSSVKRLLAYSSIAHAGYIVCGVLVFPGSAGVAAMIAYMIVYMLMNIGAFGVAGLIEQETGADDIRNFTGLSSRNPRLAAFMMFFLFSLVGLPPMAGFAVKWILLAVLWQHHLIIPVAAILANTLFSLFYYMRIARAMYFESSDLSALKASGPATGLLSVCAVSLVLLFLGWGMLNSFSHSIVISAFK